MGPVKTVSMIYLGDHMNENIPIVYYTMYRYTGKGKSRRHGALRVVDVRVSSKKY